jgi:DNA-binding MarR family transcriptional regulator
MTRLLDKLEERGLVEREAVPGDRRALLIRLTAQGQALWAEVSPCAQKIHDRAMSTLAPAEQAELTRLLLQVRDNLVAED